MVRGFFLWNPIALFLESVEPLDSKLDFSGSLTSAYSVWEEYLKLHRHAHSFALCSVSKPVKDMDAIHPQDVHILCRSLSKPSHSL